MDTLETESCFCSDCLRRALAPQPGDCVFKNGSYRDFRSRFNNANSRRHRRDYRRFDWLQFKLQLLRTATQLLLQPLPGLFGVGGLRFFHVRNAEAH